jgi:hypothetical protein
VDEILAVGRMVCLDESEEAVVVTGVDDGVAEDDHRRHQGTLRSVVLVPMATLHARRRRRKKKKQQRLLHAYCSTD